MYCCRKSNFINNIAHCAANCEVKMSEFSYPFVVWVDQKKVEELPSATYWNDRDAERKKCYDISNGDFSKLELEINREGVLEQVKTLVNAMPDLLRGRGASLASGVCWLEAMLLRDQSQIEHISCVEFSRHRIFDLAPLILNHYNINPDRVELCYGSFYELRFADAELDFVLLAQAFHHAFDPEKLLAEVKRVLKPNGSVLIVGEHFFGISDIFSRFIKHIAKIGLNYKNYRERSRLIPDWRTLFPVSREKGDHHYTHQMYRLMFETEGFRFKRYISRSAGLQAYLLNKKECGTYD